MKKFPSYIQTESKDCGPTSLKIICKYFGNDMDIVFLRNLSQTNREGSNLLGLFNAAEQIGFKAIGTRIAIDDVNTINLPCILHWNDIHFVVLYKIKNETYYISDPAVGLIKYNISEFMKLWFGKKNTYSNHTGLALLLEPTELFYKKKRDIQKLYKISSLFKYLRPYKKYLIQIFFGLLVASILELSFPFLTQKIVDIGIGNKNFHFIYLILFAQLFLYLGKTILEFTRSWISLNISTRINITLISDFFIKLMSLPISFFDSKLTGDIINRINDHHRIERMLTTTSLSTLFSIISLILMGGVLAYYNFYIFFIFFIGSILYVLWIYIFLKHRKIIDYKKFSEFSNEQSKIIELVNGMQEIKLHNAEKMKRWSWELIQVRLLNISIKSLLIDQAQSIGSNLINELKNILIIFFSARLVIINEMTIGEMLAINSIIGGLNIPILQLINFIREAQDARISLERLSEIHKKESETIPDVEKFRSIPLNADIIIEDLSYKYCGSNILVLENINLKIPANKITAIVGASGSGKTTLMKLLLKFYEPSKGNIYLSSKFEEIGKDINLNKISQNVWRAHIGAVMQDSYIFNDTIANNIAIGVEQIDENKLNFACQIANINEFILNLPSGLNTEIGLEGIGLSMGQKQRLLIARAVYKNPEILFFDEATSMLDANNEMEIMNKLSRFYNNKTVVVIAHRLSTVMNADQIIVLEKGKVVETGNHKNLVQRKNHYFKLLNNQMLLFN